MKKIILTMALLYAPFAMAEPLSRSDYDVLEAAQTALASGDAAPHIEALRTLAETCPNTADVHIILGFALYQDAQYEAAREPLLTAQALGRQDAQIFAALIDIDRRAAMWMSVIGLYQQWHVQDPANVDVLYGWSQVLMSQQQWQSLALVLDSWGNVEGYDASVSYWQCRYNLAIANKQDANAYAAAVQIWQLAPAQRTAEQAKVLAYLASQIEDYTAAHTYADAANIIMPLTVTYQWRLMWWQAADDWPAIHRWAVAVVEDTTQNNELQAEAMQWYLQCPETVVTASARYAMCQRAAANGVVKDWLFQQLHHDARALEDVAAAKHWLDAWLALPEVMQVIWDYAIDWHAVYADDAQIETFAIAYIAKWGQSEKLDGLLAPL